VSAAVPALVAERQGLSHAALGEWFAHRHTRPCLKRAEPSGCSDPRLHQDECGVHDGTERSAAMAVLPQLSSRCQHSRIIVEILVVRDPVCFARFTLDLRS
jgi:hypothetical protein